MRYMEDMTEFGDSIIKEELAGQEADPYGYPELRMSAGKGDNRMGFWGHLKKVGVVVAPIVATAVGGPLVGKITGVGLGALLKDDEQKDMYEKWCDYAKSIDVDEGFTNGQRFDLLTRRVKRDMMNRDGKEPKDRIVKWTAEGVVLEIKGDFDEEE